MMAGIPAADLSSTRLSATPFRGGLTAAACFFLTLMLFQPLSISALSQRSRAPDPPPLFPAFRHREILIKVVRIFGLFPLAMFKNSPLLARINRINRINRSAFLRRLSSLWNIARGTFHFGLRNRRLAPPGRLAFHHAAGTGSANSICTIAPDE
jgi:hypothetical protein